MGRRQARDDRCKTLQYQVTSVDPSLVFKPVEHVRREIRSQKGMLGIAIEASTSKLLQSCGEQADRGMTQRGACGVVVGNIEPQGTALGREKASQHPVVPRPCAQAR